MDKIGHKIRKAIKSSLSFVVPALFIFAVWYFQIYVLKRSYWLGTTDVEMDFGFRSLAISEGYFFKHGFGLFVDFLGALIAFVGQFSLNNLEQFFGVAYCTGLLALIAGVAFIQKKMFDNLSPLLFTIALLVFFINPSVRLYMGYWSAEMFVTFFGMLAVYGFWNSAKEISNKNLFLAGFLGGFAMTIKPYFIPFIVASCIGYIKIWYSRNPEQPSIRAFMKFLYPYLMGFLVSLFVGFLPFINGIRATAWAMLYGVREQSLIDIMRINAEVFLGSDLAWFLLTFVILFALLFTLRITKQQSSGYGGDTSTILVLTLSILLTLILTFVKGGGGALSQAPGAALRFLLPVAIYEFFGVFFILRCFKNEIAIYLKIIILLILSALLVFELYGDFSWINNQKLKDVALNSSINSKKELFFKQHGYNPRILVWDEINSPIVALSGGNNYVKGLFSKEIMLLFPGVGYKSVNDLLDQHDLDVFDIIVYPKNGIRRKDDALVKDAGFSIIESENLTFIRRP